MLTGCIATALCEIQRRALRHRQNKNRHEGGFYRFAHR
jgi:hypothetical protein